MVSWCEELGSVQGPGREGAEGFTSLSHVLGSLAILDPSARHAETLLPGTRRERWLRWAVWNPSASAALCFRDPTVSSSSTSRTQAAPDSVSVTVMSIVGRGGWAGDVFLLDLTADLLQPLPCPTRPATHCLGHVLSQVYHELNNAASGTTMGTNEERSRSCSCSVTKTTKWIAYQFCRGPSWISVRMQIRPSLSASHRGRAGTTRRWWVSMPSPHAFLPPPPQSTLGRNSVALRRELVLCVTYNTHCVCRRCAGELHAEISRNKHHYKTGSHPAIFFP